LANTQKPRLVESLMKIWSKSQEKNKQKPRNHLFQLFL